jgi:hypothetical protein
MRSALSAGAAVLTLACACARADMVGATVAGILEFPDYVGNYFDPITGYVPAGFGNSSGPTIVLSGTGGGNFAFLQGGGTVEDPVVDSWLAEFDGPQLTVTFRNQYYNGTLSGSKLTFKSAAFVGRSITLIGSDAFPSSGNGPMTATLVGDTISLSVAPQCGYCYWTPFVYSNTYALSPGTLLAGLTLKSALVAGCKSVTGTVTLSNPAPVGGVVVMLSDTLDAATTPVSLKIPEGSASRSFTVKTAVVASTQSGTVSATLGGITTSQVLTVRPMGLSSLTLTPSTVVGGQPVIGKATLECKAGPGPITVDLASSNAAVANPVAVDLVVPQGVQSQTFDVATSAVLAKTSVAISGTANGITKSKTLTVTVAAAVSPTSLKFGSVVVGTTSGVLSTVLTNKGAVPYSITSLGLTGTSAKYFAQSNDCPATLDAGASCTIGVTFAPTVIGSKTAKLSIATTATATPLSVSVSGTGVSPP